MGTWMMMMQVCVSSSIFQGIMVHHFQLQEGSFQMEQEVQ